MWKKKGNLRIKKTIANTILVFTITKDPEKHYKKWNRLRRKMDALNNGSSERVRGVTI